MTEIPPSPKSIENEDLIDEATDIVVKELTKKVIAPTHIDFATAEEVKTRRGTGTEAKSPWRERIDQNEYTFQPNDWDEVWATKAFTKIRKPEGDTEVRFIVVSRRYTPYGQIAEEGRWAFTRHVIEKKLGLEIPKKTKKKQDKKGHKIKKQEYLYQQAETLTSRSQQE